MPIDLSSYGLDEEATAKLTVAIQAEVDENAKGLSSKNSDLIGRLQTAKAQAEESALKAASIEEDAKVALAEKGTDVEAYKKAIAERDQKIKDVTADFQQKDSDRVKEMKVNEFVGSNISKDPAARAYMTSVYLEKTDVIDGEFKPKDVTQTLEDLNKRIVSDEAYSKYVLSGVGSGSGAPGSGEVSSASIPQTNTKAEAARKAGDVTSFLSESLKG